MLLLSFPSPRRRLESSLSYMGEVIHRIEEARDALVSVQGKGESGR